MLEETGHIASIMGNVGVIKSNINFVVVWFTFVTTSTISNLFCKDPTFGGIEPGVFLYSFTPSANDHSKFASEVLYISLSF